MNAQLIFNHEHKVLFCLVEKNGNTNVRIMFFIAAGLVPVTSATQPRSELIKLVSRYTNRIRNPYAQLKHGDTMESLWAQYYKTMIVRHPLERLLSAYRDKLEGPSVKRNRLKDPYDNNKNNFRLSIFKTVYPERYQQWLDNLSMEYYVTFSDFIQFLVDKPNADLNVHYRPVVSLCHPCSVKYDFYGAFKQFDQDAQILATKLGIAEYISNPFHISNKTVDLLSTFYSQLSQNLKEQLFRDWYSELEFYYYLYPEERNSHKSILNIDEDIPIPINLTSFSYS